MTGIYGMARMSLHVHLKPYDMTHWGIPHTNWANTVFKGVFMSKNYNLGFKSLTYLTACALNDKTPDMALVPDDEFFKIFELSKLHSVTSIVSFAFNKYDDSRLTNDYKLAWDMSAVTAFKRRALFDAERQQICMFLEQNGIWHIPLKGVILQDLYPHYEMREMADNDLLIDERYREDIKKYMLNRGYSIHFAGVTNHDEYTKPPVYNFEFHTRLFQYTFSEKFAEYYNNVKTKLIKDEGSEYGFHFTNEDFYIYMMAHAYKHFKEGGTGIRSLTDVYIFNKACGDVLDRQYLSEEFSKLGIRGFEIMCRKVSKLLFTDPGKTLDAIENLTPSQRRFLVFLSYTGAYGTDEEFVKSKFKKITGSDKMTFANKLKYYNSRLFPGESYYEEAHPVLYKHKILRPGFLMYRAVNRLIVNRKKIINELKTINKKKK